MSKIRDSITAAKTFVVEVAGETRKSTWPNKQELTESTAVVIVSVVLLSVCVGVFDKILISLLKLLVP